MPTLNIQGKQVQVDDSFLQLSPEAQNSTVDEIAHSMGIGPGSGDSPAPAPAGSRPSGDDVSAISAAQALPVIGAYAPKAAAAIRSLARGGSVADNQKQIETDIADYQAKHPVESTVGNMAIGSLPYMVAGEFAGPAKLLGMTGSLPGMVTRGALSGAGIGAVDAATRGENPISGAASGFATGAVGPLAGRAIGATVRGVRNLVSTPKRVPITVDLNGNSVEVPKSAVSGDFNDQWQEERARKGVYGDDAQDVAQAADARRQAQTQAATQQFGDELRGGPGPALPQPTPTEAAGQTVTELAQQHNDAIEAQARHEAQLAAEGAGIRTDVSASLGAPEQPETPGIAYAQQIQRDLQAAEQRAKSSVNTNYGNVGTFEGTYHPEAWSPVGQEVRNYIATPKPGVRPLTLDPQSNLTSNANAMLKVLDRLGLRQAPRAAPVESGLGAQHAQDVADIRAKFGDAAAVKYDQQQRASAGPAPQGPRQQSLLEFLASKGGLGPDQELEAIGAHTHTVNVDGLGRRKLVRQGGWPLDYAREAAEEAGYMRPGSTPTDLLDAIDGEMRGQKRYPAGHEGYQTAREGRALDEREQYEQERAARDHEEALAEAGHGDLGPEVKARASRLMQSGMDADAAVEHAFAQLEQEDAARAAAAHAGFPGDTAAPAPAPKTGRPLSPVDVEAARQEMLGYLQDARMAQARGGSGTDAYAAQRVMDAFDRFHNAVLSKEGAFSGDAKGYRDAIRKARASHASYRNTFTNQRRGDNVGPTIQKITGAYNAEPAGADTVARSIWGSPSNPGAGNTRAIGQRLQRIFGDGSPQMQNYKQGLINHILNTPEGMEALTPAKQANRLQTYLQTDHAREFFSDAERTRLMQHAQDLRAGGSIAPEARTEGQKLINKLADGTLSEQDLISRILLRDGTMSNGTLSLLKELQGKVSQPAWNKIRQVVWQGLNERPRGVTEWGPQALSQRISRFIGERGGQPSEGAKLLFSPRELEIMRSFADHHMALAPKPGVVNNSGSADIGMKLAKHGISHFGAMLGTMLGGHTIAGRLAGMGAGEVLQRATGKLTNAQQVERTRQLFLGNRVMPELNPQFDRAAAILGHAARPVIGGP